MTATMESLIGMVNRIQRACTVLGDYGGDGGASLPTLWEALPSVVVVGGQVLSLTLLWIARLCNCSSLHVDFTFQLAFLDLLCLRM